MGRRAPVGSHCNRRPLGLFALVEKGSSHPTHASPVAFSRPFLPACLPRQCMHASSLVSNRLRPSPIISTEARTQSINIKSDNLINMHGARSSLSLPRYLQAKDNNNSNNQQQSRKNLSNVCLWALPSRRQSHNGGWRWLAQGRWFIGCHSPAMRQGGRVVRCFAGSGSKYEVSFLGVLLAVSRTVVG